MRFKEIKVILFEANDLLIPTGNTRARFLWGYFVDIGIILEDWISKPENKDIAKTEPIWCRVKNRFKTKNGKGQIPSFESWINK